jgi:hypothetical protein
LVAQLISKNSGLHDSSYKKYGDKPTMNSMFCAPVEREELCKLIAGLKVSKSAWPDRFAPKLIKEISAFLIDPLLLLYNLSLTTGKVSNDLKIAKVIPIYKMGETFLTSNCRPISLLNIFNKLLEKLVSKRLYSHLEVNNILYPYQFRFRKNHNTVLALVEMIDNICERLDHNEVTIGIYLDSQKAFDTVNHNILLQKLYNYGIRGTVYEWFKDYLHDRHQFTVVNGAISRITKISCGVPQGSVLNENFYKVPCINH